MNNNNVIATLASIDRNTLGNEEQLHLDLFMMSYFTGGSTIYELASLTDEEMCDDYLVVERFESQLSAYTPMDNTIKEIVSRYKADCHFPYILPVFNESHNTHELRLRRSDEVVVEVNTTLRKLALNAGIEGFISIGSTRRLFVETLLGQLVSFEEISRLAGCYEEEVDMYCKLMLKHAI